MATKPPKQDHKPEDLQAKLDAKRAARKAKHDARRSQVCADGIVQYGKNSDSRKALGDAVSNQIVASLKAEQTALEIAEGK